MNIEELIKSFAIESAKFHLETYGRTWGHQVTIDHLPKQQQEHLEQCKEVLRHYGMLEEGLYKGNCKIVPEGTSKRIPEVLEGNPWIKNTGEQPVDDTTLVDVKFFDEDYVYRNNPAKTWEWATLFKNDGEIQYWRYAE